MSREILFRGKRFDDGKWIYGWFSPYPFGSWPLKAAIIPLDDAEAGELHHVEVDPATVGQYTGLKDRNGKRIFEGDVLEGDLGDLLDVGATWKGIVTWGGFGWCTMNQYGSDPMDENDIKEGAVIGNIHDNPELKEV